MKKNILTIIIMAITLVNTILLGILIFTIVPTANKTNQLVSRVVSIIDLELESPKGEGEVPVADIDTFNIPDKLTINLKKDESGAAHYAMVYVSLSMNNKSEDYKELQPKVEENVNPIKEIVTEEFAKYTMNDVEANKEAIKEQVINRLHDLFQSDFIINVSFGNIVLG
jgi:flagellar FliL protein